MLFLSEKIYVDDSPIHGRGVFTKELIKSGELIEECHYIKLNQGFSNLDDRLKDIVFFLSIPNDFGIAVVLGYGSIYNHSDLNNATWKIDQDKKCYIFFAIKDINPGEEICTNYKKSNNFKF
jgi:SET domain-containing protein